MVRNIPRTKKLIQLGVIFILAISVLINITFIVDDKKFVTFLKDGYEQKPEDDDMESLKKRCLSGVNCLNDHTKPIAREVAILSIISSKSTVLATINNISILFENNPDTGRGIHVVVVHETHFYVMARRVFDTYATEDESKILIDFISTISSGRLIIFAVKDEGSFHLSAGAREYLSLWGSESVKNLKWRDMWAFVVVKDGKKVAESYSKNADLSEWAPPATVQASFTAVSEFNVACEWDEAAAVVKRRETFCSRYEGYYSVCRCIHPDPIDLKPSQNAFINMADVPVAIIASNRPNYLFRTLMALLKAPGANVQMVTVFIDGFYEEPMAVTKLFGVRGVHHTPLGARNAQISQHYKASLSATFLLYPNAKYMLILEEDLEVSSDFFNYFNQLLPLMRTDPSIYCISAWNDQGYEHSCEDPSLLYRVETMPGLGWLLKKELFVNELEPNWPTPEKQWDWDMWMRNNAVRRDRECIIPDVSRTYHFGKKGLNVNPYFQDSYFKQHALQPSIVRLKNVDKLMKNDYEAVIIDLLKHSTTLNHSKFPCNSNFIPNVKNQTFVLFIKMQSLDDYSTWMPLSTCFHIWDLDARGFHKGMWRLFMKKNHILVVGVPASPYSRFKVPNITPLDLSVKSTKSPKS